MVKEAEIGLSEARERLRKCRELFILSSLALILEDPILAEGRGLWIGVWLSAFREQEELVRHYFAPAKRNLGLLITNLSQEEQVKRYAGEFAEKLGLASQAGVAIVEFHITRTKEIQKEEGVGRPRE